VDRWKYKSSFHTVVVVFVFLVATFAIHLNYAQLVHVMYFISKEEFTEKMLGVMKKLNSIWNKGLVNV